VALLLVNPLASDVGDRLQPVTIGAMMSIPSLHLTQSMTCMASFRGAAENSDDSEAGHFLREGQRGRA
jgi:hypothetical protein